MSDSEPSQEDVPKKSSKLPMILGLVLALAGGGGGFFAVYSGLLLGTESDAHADEDGANDTVPAKIGELPDVAYVAVTPLVVSLGNGDSGAHLRFVAQLEVGRAYKDEVEMMLPRVIDVLNSYLRALETRDIADKTALMRLRAQMLRRVQIVTGGDRVNDLLIMEFILN